jgi:hypothetical protein
MVERYIIPEWLINRDIIRDGTTIRLMDDNGVITENTVADCRTFSVLDGIEYHMLFPGEQGGFRELILRYDANNSQVYSIYKGIVNKHHIVFEENPEWVLQIAKKKLALGKGINERLAGDSVLSDLPVELFERISAQLEDSVNEEGTLRVDKGGGQGGGQRKKRSNKRSNKRSKRKRSKSKRSKSKRSKSKRSKRK